MKIHLLIKLVIPEHTCDSMNIDFLVVAESEDDALEQLYNEYPSYSQKGFSIDGMVDTTKKSIDVVDRSGCYDY